jgi:phage/plasmid-associated DNA primase
MSNSLKSCLWALKPRAENIAEQTRTCPGSPLLRHSWGCLAIKIKRMTCRTGPAPPYLLPFWPKLNVNSLLMFKWTNHVKVRQFLPQPHPFSIKNPSFQASWSKPLSPAWDTFRPRAPPHVFTSKKPTNQTKPNKTKQKQKTTLYS